MRIKMTASHEELSIPEGHPLHGTHARLLVWDYRMDGRDHDGKPSGATITITPSTLSYNTNALKLEKDIQSQSTIQAIADALDALDGNALWQALQPLIPPTEEPPTEAPPAQDAPKPARKKTASKKVANKVVKKASSKERKAQPSTALEPAPAPAPAKTRGRPRKNKESHSDE